MYAALALGAIVFASPVLENLGYWSANSDWFFITAAPGAARNTILRYHQLPLWNPFIYGGTSVIGYPRSSFLSPLFVFPLAFGIFQGIKIKFVVTTVLSAVGAYRMGRRMGLVAPAAALSSVVYTFTSVVPLWMYCGAPQHTTAWIIPWLFASLHDAIQPGRPVPNRSLVFAAGWLLLMFLDGSVYYTAFTALFACVYATAMGMRQRRAAPLLAAGLMLAFVGVTGAVKVLPVYETTAKYPRQIERDLEYISVSTQLFDATLGRDQDPTNNHFDPAEHAEAARLGKVPWDWWEYGAYIGVVPAILALASFFYLARSDLEVPALLVLSFLFSLGYASPVNVWAATHWLPGFREMQFPTRSVIVFVFFAALAAGKCAHAILSKLGPGRAAKAHAVAWVVVVLVAVDMTFVSRPVLAGIFHLKPGPVESFEFAQTRQIVPYGGIINSSYILVESNVGAIVTQPDVPMPRSAIGVESEAYRGEAFLRDAHDAPRARVMSFSPNRVVVELDAAVADVLVLNQNFDDGWTATIDGVRRPALPFTDLLRESILRENYGASEYTDEYLKTSIPFKYANGLVSAPIEPGTHRVIFRYSPLSFWFGAGISLTALFLFGLYLSSRLDGRRLVLATGLLVVVTAGTAISIRLRAAGHAESLRQEHAQAIGR